MKGYPEAIPVRTEVKANGYYACTFSINGEFETTYWVGADTQVEAEAIAWNRATLLAAKEHGINY